MKAPGGDIRVLIVQSQQQLQVPRCRGGGSTGTLIPAPATPKWSFLQGPRAARWREEYVGVWRPLPHGRTEGHPKPVVLWVCFLAAVRIRRPWPISSLVLREAVATMLAPTSW